MKHSSHGSSKATSAFLRAMCKSSLVKSDYSLLLVDALNPFPNLLVITFLHLAQRKFGGATVSWHVNLRRFSRAQHGEVKRKTPRTSLRVAIRSTRRLGFKGNASRRWIFQPSGWLMHVALAVDNSEKRWHRGVTLCLILRFLREGLPQYHSATMLVRHISPHEKLNLFLSWLLLGGSSGTYSGGGPQPGGKGELKTNLPLDFCLEGLKLKQVNWQLAPIVQLHNMICLLACIIHSKNYASFVCVCSFMHWNSST